MHHGQPSQTARSAAAHRAIHQILEGGAIFKDPFASRILDERTAVSLNEMAADESPGPMRLFIAARSRFSEDALAACVARGVRQIVILGAGLDTFSLRNPFADAGVRVFEVDYPRNAGLEARAAEGSGIGATCLAHLCTHRLRAAKPCQGIGWCRLSERLPRLLSVAWRRCLSFTRSDPGNARRHRQHSGIRSGVSSTPSRLRTILPRAAPV